MPWQWLAIVSVHIESQATGGPGIHQFVHIAGLAMVVA